MPIKCHTHHLYPSSQKRLEPVILIIMIINFIIKYYLLRPLVCLIFINRNEYLHLSLTYLLYLECINVLGFELTPSASGCSPSFSLLFLLFLSLLILLFFLLLSHRLLVGSAEFLPFFFPPHRSQL